MFLECRSGSRKVIPGTLNPDPGQLPLSAVRGHIHARTFLREAKELPSGITPIQTASPNVNPSVVWYTTVPLPTGEGATDKANLSRAGQRQKDSASECAYAYSAQNHCRRYWN